MGSRYSQPIISLVTPNFNGEEFLEATLDSVLSQGYPNLEYFVIDGASEDDSQAIIQSYANRLSDYVSEPDEGHAHALGKGLAVVSGDIMGWLNSDDILLPGALETVAEVFSKYPQVEWITGQPSALHESGTLRHHKTRNWSRLRVLCGNYRWIQQESTFWRRSLWERAGGYVSKQYQLATDFELWVRFFRYADLYSVDIPLAAFRYRPGQRSKVFRRSYESEAMSILCDEFKSLDPEFERTFAALLPKQPRTLTDHEIRKADRRFSVIDPPIITRNDIKSRAPRTYQTEIAQAHFHDRIRSLKRSDSIEQFENLHSGEDCYILCQPGNWSPSFVNSIGSEILFLSDDAIHEFSELDCPPVYYSCFDHSCISRLCDQIDSILFENLGVTAFFPTMTSNSLDPDDCVLCRTNVPPAPGRVFIQLPHLAEQSSLPSVHNQILLQDALGSTTIVSQIQLANHMGFRRAFILRAQNDDGSNAEFDDYLRIVKNAFEIEINVITAEEITRVAVSERKRSRLKLVRLSRASRLVRARARVRYRVRKPVGYSSELDARVGDKWYSRPAHALRKISPGLFLRLQSLRRTLFGRRAN